MGKKTIIKDTAILAFPRIIKFIVGIIRTKFIAIYLGTEGVGIISQLRNILRNLSRLALSGLNNGLVKQISQSKENRNGIILIIKCYLNVISLLSLFLFVSGFAFSKQITLFVFGDLKYLLYYRIGFIGLPFTILSTSSFAVIKAYREIKKLAYAQIINILINFVLFIPLIYFFKITGAVVYVVLSFITVFLTYEYVASKILRRHEISMLDIVRSKPGGGNYKQLMSFFSTGLIVVIVLFITDVASRSIVVQNLGIKELGVYAPIISWGALITKFIMPSLSTHLFPRISESKNNENVVTLINDTLRLMTLFSLPLLIIIICFRIELIKLFYSVEFLDAAIYLPFHFIGILFVIWCEIFNQVYFPTGRLKLVVSITIAHNIFTLLLLFYLVPRYGLFGWMARFTVTPFFLVIAHYFILRKEISFRLLNENVKLLVYSIITAIFSLVFSNSVIRFYILPISLIGFLFILTDNEKKKIIKSLKFKKKNIGK